MKKILSIVSLIVFIYGIIPVSFVSCTDVSGDGVDSLYYGGSTVPQNKSYRNPVWEPDLDGGTVFKGPSNFIAVGSETQWAKGLTYKAPVIYSSNLMDWKFDNEKEAFPIIMEASEEDGITIEVPSRPDWAEGRLHSITVDYARTISVTSYWMFYQLGDTQAIGVACAKSPQGPFTDFGKLIDAEELSVTTLKQPYFAVFGTSFYLFYTTEKGSYMQGITLRKDTKPTLKGEPELIAGKDFQDVAVYRTSTTDYYLFGTVKDGDLTEIRYARSSSVSGPFVDKDGNDVLTGGNGTLLIESDSRIANPENVCRVIQNEDGLEYILYNATDTTKPQLESGFNRRPLFMNPMPKDEDGWFTTVIRPQVGWTSPRFK